jgi:hypothetical protein
MMVKKIRLLIIVSLCLGILTACHLPQSSTAVSSGKVSAWIDKPLNGSVHPLAPLEIIFHGADAGGVSRYELRVGGILLTEGPSPDPSKTLLTTSYTWQPVTPGGYTIQARVMNHANQWSDPAIVTITIEGPSPTPTETPTETPTPTNTATPSPSPTPEGTTFSNPSVSTTLFYYRIADCPNRTPNQVAIEITATDPDEIVNVELYYRLKSKATNTVSEWQSRVMLPLGNGVYRLTIDANDLPAYGVAGEAWLQYQFISSNRVGLISRTEVFFDITIKGCGS